MARTENMNIEKWESQVRKGTLEFIILLTLREKEFYGYELITKVKDITSLDISEGTLYPLLNRLKKDELIISKWVEFDTGVPRKYYNLSDKGKDTLVKMIDSWNNLSNSIKKMV